MVLSLFSRTPSPTEEMCIRDRVTSFDGLEPVKHMLVQNQCCKRAYIRGAFLASGSMSDPEKGYHFEIVCSTEEKAEKLQEMLTGLDVYKRQAGALRQSFPSPGPGESNRCDHAGGGAFGTFRNGYGALQRSAVPFRGAAAAAQCLSLIHI